MSSRDLERLVDALDLHHRYNLRRTSARRERLISFLSTSNLNMAPPQTPPPTNPSQPQAPTQQQLYMIAQSTRSLQVAKFTGFVPVGVQNRDQLMAYDVNRWLCDVETHCQVKGITDDVLKIKEAKLAVSSDYGDASVVLNTGRMNEITDYGEFKAKCQKFWRSASERDRYHALSDFLSVSYSSSMGVFAGDLEKARMRILQDLNGDSNFTKGDAAAWSGGSRSSEILVSLDEVVNYFSWGVLFKAAPPSFREALRKVEIKYSDDYLDILSAVQSEMFKQDKGAKIEMSAFASSKGRKQEATGFSGRKQFSSSKSRNVTCFRCEKQGHISKNCNVAVKCSFCHKQGHIASKCFEAKKQNSKIGKKQDSNNSNCNVIEDQKEISTEASS